MATVGQVGSHQKSGIDPKVGALLSYLLGLLGAVIFFFISKEDKYVRFHAAQAILFNVAYTIVYVIGFISAIVASFLVFSITSNSSLANLTSSAIVLLMMVVGLVVWITLLIKAWTGAENGNLYRLPLIGNLAEKIAGK